MKIFVTGGTGFIGSHFLMLALAAGHEVIALRRPGSRTRVKLQIEPIWVEGPLDGNYIDSLTGCDVLVHLASHTPNPPYDSFASCTFWNVTASLGLAEQAWNAGVRHFVVAGSCFEHGHCTGPLGSICADTPLAPVNSYASSKAAASVAFEGFARANAAYLQILRIYQVFGEGEQESRMWPSLRRAALSGADFKMTPGDQVRDFVTVERVAEQFLSALTFSNVLAGTPLISSAASGHPMTLRAFAEQWWEHWNAKGKLLVGAIPYRQNELMRLVPDPRTIISTPGI